MPIAMPSLPPRRRRKLPVHWLGDDGKPVSITHCGQLLSVKILRRPEGSATGAKRGEITDFSKASRLRLLKKIATLDWSEAGPALFCTVTYPNRSKLLKAEEINTHLHLFRRAIEKITEKKLCILWRVEWVERKRGKHKGFIYPHLHFIFFRTNFIAWQEIRAAWKRAIGEIGYVRTDVERIENLRKCGYYVSKYCAKEGLSLVNAAYLDSVHMGRQWGLLRPELYPSCEERTTRIELGELHDLIRALSIQCRPVVAEMPDSYTLLGPSAHVVSQLVWPMKG